MPECVLGLFGTVLQANSDLHEVCGFRVAKNGVRAVAATISIGLVDPHVVTTLMVWVAPLVGKSGKAQSPLAPPQGL